MVTYRTTIVDASGNAATERRVPLQRDMAITLTNIPGIMRSKGWANGARLLEIWFSRPNAIAPEYGQPDTSTIRMDTWALTFQRARQVYDQLFRERIWANPPAQREIASMLQRKGLIGRTLQSFGNLSQPVQLLDADYVNYRTVGLFDLDDMTAALGRFTFRVVVVGTITPETGSPISHRVTITNVGVYIRDSFDFNGNQFLGYWDDSDNSVSMVNFLSGDAVSNADFRSWRSTHGRGGDFLVFSDVKWMSLTSRDSFVI